MKLLYQKNITYINTVNKSFVNNVVKKVDSVLWNRL